MEDLVSVIITTYGRTDTLLRALNSVTNQTYSNLEILVVDDNDNPLLKKRVKTIISEFDDPRVTLIVNKNNVGGANARNIGIQNSNGEYISFLDDDDEYYPTRIEKQLKLLKNSSEKTALVYAYCVGIDSRGREKFYKNNAIGNCIFEAMLGCPAATSQWLCKKKLLESVGNFSNVPCKQDSILMLKLLTHGYEINRVPEVLSIYHDDEIIRISRQSHDKRIVGEEALRELCRANFKLLSEKEISEVEYHFNCRLSPHYFGAKEYSKFQECVLNIVRKYPLRKNSISCYRSLFKILLRKIVGKES